MPSRDRSVRWFSRWAMSGLDARHPARSHRGADRSNQNKRQGPPVRGGARRRCCFSHDHRAVLPEAARIAVGWSLLRAPLDSDRDEPGEGLGGRRTAAGLPLLPLLAQPTPTPLRHTKIGEPRLPCLRFARGFVETAAILHRSQQSAAVAVCFDPASIVMRNDLLRWRPSIL